MSGNPPQGRGGAPSSTAHGSPGSGSYAEGVGANAATADRNAGASSGAPGKKRRHRAGKKRRNRRQSFAATAETMGSGDMTEEQRPRLGDVQQPNSRGSNSFYRLRDNHSSTSLESEALLDHRDQSFAQPRRQSVQAPNNCPPTRSSPPRPNAFGRSKLSHQQRLSESDQDDDADDTTPLMGTSQRDIRAGASYGGLSVPASNGRERPGSRSAPDMPRLPTRPAFAQHHSNTNLDEYHVNNPPSMPASPVLGPDAAFDDVMLTVELERARSLEERESRPSNKTRDVLIDMDNDEPYAQSAPPSPPGPGEMRRRTTMQAEEDVCFPLEGMSEMGDQDYMSRHESEGPRGRRRRRRWPDLAVLEAWSHEEKEQRTMEGMRMRKVSEPLMVGGRLRPQKRPWHKDDDDAPYRFTYFNEEFDNTIHSQSISELVQPGQTFRNLFVPDRPVLDDSSDDETDEDETSPINRNDTLDSRQNGHSRASQAPSHLSAKHNSSGEQTRSSTPGGSTTPKPDDDKPKRYGPRPAFWLDVLSPTDAEMRIISKAFGIHPLTAEDILMQEAREKVELFKHYYFIHYRTFEQDENSEDYLEPVNFYLVVFREGVISFHFSMTPHPANVRRRIRQLQDYLILSPDWISYGIIDDITDAYAPLIQRIEEEVDDIDETILRLHSEEEEQEAEKSKSYSYNNPHYEKQEEGTKEQQDSGRNMLRRVGECRKKVMSLYRLLGNKADVIKGFAKRCTEQWDVAPRSEIGLYLGDIQDHIVTMTGNLSHYENLLSRAHSNYLAQINIRMNERQEKTSDILGKLTVLGTIVLPMNVVTGIWGMNCIVPGQDIENLNWFWAITGSLILFGLSCFFIAKRIYGIV